MKVETKQYYIEVAVANKTPWSKSRLTYTSDKKLQAGRIVKVPFGNKEYFAVVTSTTTNSAPPPENLKSAQPTTHTMPKSNYSFFEWIESYYPSRGSGHIVKFFPSYVDAPLIEKLGSTPATVDEPHTHTLEIELTPEQAKAYTAISEDLKTPIILHGITGSGKTTVYAKRILECLHSKKHALIIVPEISLIAQLEKTLTTLLPSVKIISYSSDHTKKEKQNAWADANSNAPKLFIGTRSSLFLPYFDLGVVVVDEAHDQGLKEDHESSHYHGLITAAALARIHEAQYIIGSATPPIAETYQMLQKGAKLVKLRELAVSNTHTRTIQLVDTAISNSKRKSHSIISQAIRLEIEKNLSNSLQTLLFINKLGTAHIVECGDCGWRATCPKCDHSFIYHQDSHTYHCNICYLTKKALNSCEDCGGKLLNKSLGIKSIESTLKKLFPSARIARFDSSNKKSESITALYQQVRDGAYDIIIGTQLMAKGFDFPLLASVGVINADSLLAIPDIYSEERLFAQIIQVSGRVGRGHRDGNVLIQTSQAKNPLYSLIIESDWDTLYAQELKKRKKHNYPPFVYLAKISVKGKNNILAKNHAQKLYDIISSDINVSTPFPAFYHKRNRSYYWQIICKTKNRQELLSLYKQVENDNSTTINLDPVTLL